MRDKRAASQQLLDANFPNLCMAMSNFQELSLMQPHESVLTSLLEPGDEMPMHFISHEWLSFKHPDPRGIQLKRMQQVFSRFDSGEQADLFKEEDYDAFLKGVSAGTSRAMSHIEVSISTRDFRSGTEFFNEVVSGFVWLDYHSIPQASKDEDFYKAVNSIPRFVNRCDYFWVCAPTAMHEELQQQRDFSSWRRRGWCRLEETTNFLSTNLKMPLVVTDQEKLSMYGFFDGLSMYTNRPERSVFNGTFTCCQLGHRCEKPDGSYEDIVCDKYAIAELLMAVFERFLLKPCGDQCYRRNLILSLAQSFFAGDPVDEERWLPPEDESVQDCLDRIRFESLDSVDGVGMESGGVDSGRWQHAGTAGGVPVKTRSLGSHTRSWFHAYPSSHQQPRASLQGVHSLARVGAALEDDQQAFQDGNHTG